MLHLLYRNTGPSLHLLSPWLRRSRRHLYVQACGGGSAALLTRKIAIARALCPWTRPQVENSDVPSVLYPIGRR